MLNQGQKEQFGHILEELGNVLDITEEQHKKAVQSYEFVGGHLAAPSSPLAMYRPEILPQGSFLLGTMIKPIHEDDELDIDLVCRLEGKNPSWTQRDLKKIIGDRLQDHGTLKKLLENPDGRRCWTLNYAESAKFHMDILPAIVSSGYRLVLEKAFSSFESLETDKLAIRITDKKLPHYAVTVNHELWPKCNPFGFGLWFYHLATVENTKTVMMSESVRPVPSYQKDKLPLQRVIQILKRHRDIMFKDDREHKPISIIITTLATLAYKKETNVLEALVNVIDGMPQHIKTLNIAGKLIKWVANPVNPVENFADKWVETPVKEKNFYHWLDTVKKDINRMLEQSNKGLNHISESMKAPFGENAITKTFSNYGDKQLILRESGALKMAATTGMISQVGQKSIPAHSNYGS